MALETNSEIRSAEDRYKGMAERPIQEGTLPDPSVGVRYHNEQFGRVTFGQSDFTYLEFSGEQEVPFPGKLGLKASVAAREAERERAMRDATVLAVLARVVVSYTDLEVADHSTAILNESVGVLDTMLKQTSESYSVGKAAQQDLLRATLERDALRERIEMLAQQRVGAEAALNALLNRSADESIVSTEWSDKVSPLQPLSALNKLVEAQAPELRAAEEEVARTEDALKLAERSYLPDFTMMGAYMNKNGLFPEWELGVRMTVPLYFWRRQEHAVAEAEFNKAAAEQSRQNSRVTLQSRLRELHRMGETALKLMSLYDKTLIPEASLTFRSAEVSYGVGEVDFLTVLNAFNAMLEYKLRYTEDVGQFQRAVAEIGPIIGEAPPEASLAIRR
jgi:outer membrane protein TolC